MQYLKFILVIILSSTIAIAKAQDVNASTIKLGPLFLGMKLAEVEKAIGEKISVKDAKKTYDDYNYSIKQLIQGFVIEIGFYEEYNENEKAPKVYVVDRLKSSDSKLKTKSGIGIGSTRASVMEILDKQNIAYHYDKYNTYDNDGKPTNVLVESLTIIDVKAGKSLILLMQNGKVVGFQLGYGDEGGC